MTKAIDHRRTAEVGTGARLELVFACRRGQTVLAHGYAEPPFRIGRSFCEGRGLHMILASSAPGVFGGDCLHQTVRVERGARVRLTSQSALQAHPAANGAPARLTTTYHVDDEATLQCQWDPLIPFARTRLEQRIALHVADAGRVYWSDAFMGGRAHADRVCADRGEPPGERWKFASLAHELALRRGGSLEYLERYRIVPAERPVNHPWIARDACYFGTALVGGPEVDVAAVLRLHEELAALDGVRAAADAVDRRLLVVRMTATAGVPFHEARARVARALAL